MKKRLICLQTRAGFVAVNIFSLLCVGDTVLKPSLFGSITHYGGPILYLILYSFALFAILVYADSGSPLQSALLRFRSRGQSTQSDAEAKGDADDALRVMDVSKSFGKGRVVDGVSFSVGTDTIFALLGPNGAGKTTTFNMIRTSPPPHPPSHLSLTQPLAGVQAATSRPPRARSRSTATPSSRTRRPRGSLWACARSSPRSTRS